VTQEQEPANLAKSDNPRDTSLAISANEPVRPKTKKTKTRKTKTKKYPKINLQKKTKDPETQRLEVEKKLPHEEPNLPLTNNSGPGSPSPVIDESDSVSPLNSINKRAGKKEKKTYRFSLQLDKGKAPGEPPISVPIPKELIPPEAEPARSASGPKPVRPGLNAEAKLVAKSRSKKPATWSPSTQNEDEEIPISTTSRPKRPTSDRRPGEKVFTVEWIGNVKQILWTRPSITLPQLHSAIAKKFGFDLDFLASICLELMIECWCEGSSIILTAENIEDIFSEPGQYFHVSMVDSI